MKPSAILVRVCTPLVFAVLLALWGGGVAAAAPAKVLRVGVSGDYAPFALAAREGGYTGLDVDIATRLAHDLHLEVAFVPFTWPQLTEQLRQGAFDVAMSGVTMQFDRATVGRYTRPYATTGAVAVIRAEDAARFDSLEGLDQAGVRIAVNAGGYLEQAGRRLFRHASLRPVPDNRSLPERVLAGTEEAALSDSAEAQTWVGRELRMIGPFTHDHKAFLLSPPSGDLAHRIDAWLAAREQDGWLDAQRRKWLGETAAMPTPAAGRDAVAGLIRLRLDLMPSVARAKRAEQVPIEDPAQEARVLKRVAAAAPKQTDRAQAVYRVIIEISKAAQSQSQVVAGTAALADLRAAIERIDEVLIPELARNAAGTLAEWTEALARDLQVPGVTKESLMRLAVALALPEDGGPGFAPAGSPKASPAAGRARRRTPTPH